MTETTDFETINNAKANLDHIYDRRDPCAYFRELGKLDYAIPERARPVFEKLIAHLHGDRSAPIHVLDLGCSYGVNAALLKYDLDLDALYQHWGREELKTLPAKDVIARDRKFFGNAGLNQPVEVTGLDVAPHALEYAAQTGLLDHAIAANLEEEALPAQIEDDLSAVDLVTSTGCVGYITEKSFARLLPKATNGEAPWFANFVLRMFPFEEIETLFGQWGYVTEKLEGKTFQQRRFASQEEEQETLQQLRAMGIDPNGVESDGYLHAEFYLSRPAADVARQPLSALL